MAKPWHLSKIARKAAEWQHDTAWPAFEDECLSNLAADVWLNRFDGKAGHPHVYYEFGKGKYEPVTRAPNCTGVARKPLRTLRSCAKQTRPSPVRSAAIRRARLAEYVLHRWRVERASVQWKGRNDFAFDIGGRPIIPGL